MYITFPLGSIFFFVGKKVVLGLYWFLFEMNKPTEKPTTWLFKPLLSRVKYQLFYGDKVVRVIYKSKCEDGKRRIPVSNDFLFVLRNIIEVLILRVPVSELFAAWGKIASDRILSDSTPKIHYYFHLPSPNCSSIISYRFSPSFRYRILSSMASNKSWVSSAQPTANHCHFQYLN